MGMSQSNDLTTKRRILHAGAKIKAEEISQKLWFLSTQTKRKLKLCFSRFMLFLSFDLVLNRVHEGLVLFSDNSQGETKIVIVCHRTNN